MNILNIFIPARPLLLLLQALFTIKYRMIRVGENTHKELVKLAKYGDAMSDIIDQLIESYKREKTKK
jgi:hypothetical protein